MRRYSEDSSLAKKVNTSTNVSQCFGSKLQVALIGNSVTESCEINERVIGSSAELSPLHINGERMSILEKVNIKEDSFHGHPKNPERSIIKDLLLKDRSKGEKSLLDSAALKNPLAIETVTKSPQVSFLCRLCNIVFRCRENYIAHRQHYCKDSQEYTCKSEESLHYLKGDISSSGYVMTLPISSSSAASASQSSKSNTSVYSLFQHGQVLPSNSEAHIQMSYHGLTNKSHIFQKSTISPSPENPPLKKRKISEPVIPVNGPEEVVKNKSLSNLSNCPQTNQQSMLVVTSASTKPSDVQMKDLRENTQVCEKMLVHPMQVNTGLSVIQEIPKVKQVESGLKDHSMLARENISTSVVDIISKPVLNSGGTVLSVQNSLQDEVNSEICLQANHTTESGSVDFALSNSKRVAYRELKVDEPKDAEIVQDLSLSKLINKKSCFNTGVSVPTTLTTINQESVAQSLVSVQRKTSIYSVIPDYRVMQGRPDTVVPMDLLEETDNICSDPSTHMQASFNKPQSIPERPVLSPSLPFFPSSVMHLVLENSAQPPLQQTVNSTLSFNLASKSPPDIPTSDKPLPVPSSTKRIIASDSFQIEKTNVETSKTKPTRPSSLPLKKKVITMIGSTLISPETPRPKKHCIQQYINGHSYTYLGLKCSTRSTYCSIYRPQPMYVPQDTDPKLSMYSNWQVVPAKNMLLGLSPGQMVGLYDSRQWLHCCSGIFALAKQSPQLLITHSSYWIYRCQELERSSKSNHLFSSPSENKFQMYKSKTEQCTSNSVEIVNPGENKEKTSFNSLESVPSSGLYSCNQQHLMVSTPDEGQHFVKAKYQDEQLNISKPLELTIPNGSKQSIDILEQNHSLSTPDNLLVSPSSNYSQFKDQQLHLPKSQQWLTNSGNTKQSFTIEIEKQQQCSSKFTKSLISSIKEHPFSSNAEEQQQNQAVCQESPVIPCASKQALNLYCRNEELNLANIQQQLFTSPKIQYSIITQDQEEQQNVTKPVETMISPKRINPTFFYQNQDEQMNSSMAVGYPERNKHLEPVTSPNIDMQVSNNQEVGSSMDSSSLSVNPETLQSLTTSCTTLIPALSPLCSGETQSSLKTVSNNSLSPARPGGQEGESDETSDSFHTIKLTELTTDEESTRSEPLNDNESALLPKRVRIFEGGFKSNEDYTYVRGRGRGKYVCEECGIRCKKPSMLKKHIRTHTDLRPFSCSHCSFAFKTKGNLTKHMKSKAHHKKCVELGIVPVPTTIDDSQIDGEALAKQEQLDKGRRQFIDGEELEDEEDEDFDEDAGDSYGEEDAEMEILSDERPINDEKIQQNNDVPGEKSKDSEEQKHEAARCLLNLSSLPTVTSETKDEPANVMSFSLQETLQLQPTISDSKEDCVSKNLIPQNNNVTDVSFLLTPPLQYRSRSSSVHIPLSPVRKQDAPTMMEGQVINQSTSFTKESAGNRRYSFSVVGELRRNIHLSESPRIDCEQLSIKSENEGHCMDFPSFSSVPSNSEDETSVSGADQPMDLSVTRDMKIDAKASVDSNPGVPEEPLDSLLGACLQYGSFTALRTGGSQMVLNLSEVKRQSQSPWDLQQQIVCRQSVDDSVVQLSPVTPPSPNDIPPKTFLHNDQSPTSCRPQAEFIVAKSGCRQNLDDGKCVCDICNKTFTKPSQLRLHVNIHYFERPFRCDSCVVSFRTKGHLQKHKRSVSHYNKVNMNQTFGTPSADNPRPFKCSDCKIAFRIHGHLAKHLRSKMHIMKLECLGRLPFGMYAEMERNGTNLNEIDTTDGDSSLESLQAIAQRLYHQEPRQLMWQQENTYGVAKCSSNPLSSSDSICVSFSQNKKLTTPMTDNFQIKQEPQDVIDSHSLKNESDSLLWSVDFKKAGSVCLDQNTQLHHHPLSCQHCGQSFVSAKTLRVHTYYHHAQWSTDGATSSSTLRPVSPVICGKSPRTPQKYASVQENIDNILSCDEYSQKCASQGGLQQQTAFLCQVCGHAFVAAQDLQKHVQTHHRDPS
ncbi:uncharacterized protein LOC106468020 isoform X1 [Limulus polyphemus]|uniref:Uncharacterized protein LOC106468020 isoform X1 n=1 Tax=Limulus polyphemus TaxID=6850 RepID=A0ABM1T823_LIMPO|nr:uncharacterized protein LOC106468020 isoform X1 [Limulus polyphemus]